MTSVDAASRAQPSRPSSSPMRGEVRPDPNDVRAMSDAFDKARGRMEKPQGQAGKKALGEGLAERRQEAATATAARPTADETRTKLTSQREGAEALAGWGGQGAAPVPAAVNADFAAPHVDPGAFAQMLADLWTRENGRGSKEVRVRFGDRAWPATGARLIRNEAGALDVQLFVGDGGRAYGDKLAELEGALSGGGVNLGSLAIENEV